MLKMLFDFLKISSGGAASNLATGAINTAGIAVVATPALLWLLNHKDETFVILNVSYGQGLLAGAVAWFVLKLALHTRAPGT